MPPTQTQAPKPLATPNDLGPDAAAKIAAAINPLVADAFALYLKTKKFPLAHERQPLP